MHGWDNLLVRVDGYDDDDDDDDDDGCNDDCNIVVGDVTMFIINVWSE